MSRKDFNNVRVEDLPQVGQHWIWHGERVRIIRVATDKYFQGGMWHVCWDYIFPDGSMNFLDCPGNPTLLKNNDQVELGRFLQKAERIR